MDNSSTSAPEPADPAPHPSPPLRPLLVVPALGQAAPGLVRQGFLRHGLRPMRPGWRHDHSP
ncbi:MAG: hypothetical protein IPG57_24750 [Burkholderiales bacterium]|nr:hypothetical protein [Burkholderiales bacterium]